MKINNLPEDYKIEFYLIYDIITGEFISSYDNCANWSSYLNQETGLTREDVLEHLLDFSDDFMFQTKEEAANKIEELSKELTDLWYSDDSYKSYSLFPKYEVRKIIIRQSTYDIDSETCEEYILRTPFAMTYLDKQSVIDSIKKAGLSYDDLAKLLIENNVEINKIKKD